MVHGMGAGLAMFALNIHDLLLVRAERGSGASAKTWQIYGEHRPLFAQLGDIEGKHGKASTHAVHHDKRRLGEGGRWALPPFCPLPLLVAPDRASFHIEPFACVLKVAPLECYGTFRN